MEWTLEVEPCSGFGVVLEWNGVTFYDWPTDSDRVEWGQILEGTSRQKLRQSQAVFYDLPKMSTFIQQA